MKKILQYTILASVIFSFAIHAKHRPLLINLRGTTTEVTNQASCAPSKWKNNTEDACECCLLEQQEEMGNASANQIIQSCKDANLCNDASLSKLKTKKNLFKGSSEELLMALYDDAVVIRNMDIDTSLLDKNNKFTETTLPKFLAQAYREKKLTNSDFSKESCIKAKNIASKGGANTAQLFLVTTTCKPGPASIYILKGATKGLDEAIKLKDLEQIPAMKAIIAPKVVRGLPSIALPIAYFKYPDKSGFGYISAMPAAKGKEFANFIIAFRDDQSQQNLETVNRGFRILGRETANFHKRFMSPLPNKIIGKTMTHDDLHVFNIFYDELGGHFTYIDNETMARTMAKKSSPYSDLIKLSLNPIRTGKRLRDLTKGVDLKMWHDNAFKNFVLGYAEAYPRQEKQVLQELKAMFNSSHPLLDAKYQVNKLPEFRTKYINPVFDSLIASFENIK